jgi:enoyl-CoA hydratase/carnithine racemase
MSEEDRNTVLYEVSDQIATVTLNRPEALNAIIDQLASELYDVMQTAASDRKVRAIVPTGAGRAFCAGGDISGFGNQTPQELITKLPRQFDMNWRPDFQTRYTYFPAIPKPIIGMIDGAAAGLGLLYALFCDIRFASEDAVLTTAFARRGLGAEYGMAWILTELVGQANALDLLISGRKIKGPEALRLGLVNQVHPPAELASATYAYAKDTWCAPSSMRMMKRAIYEVPFQNLHEAVMMANQDMLVSNVSADFKEGTASFREKRPPWFQDL